MLLIQDFPLSSQSVAAQCYFTQVIPPPPALRSHPQHFASPNPCSFFFPPVRPSPDEDGECSDWRSRYQLWHWRYLSQCSSASVHTREDAAEVLNSAPPSWHPQRPTSWIRTLQTTSPSVQKSGGESYDLNKFLQWGTLSNKQKRSIHLQCKKLPLGYREMWSHKHLHNVSTAHFVYRYK